MKRIGDILTRNKKPVVVKDGTTYRQVTIRTNYKGVVLRGSQDGSAILTKNQFAVSAGQFILSRIDARNGAFGIVPEELEGAIVSNEFLAFDINEDEVEREFFNVFLQSPIFLEACIKASRGNTNRKRVEETFFLNYEVNLPPLREQHELIKQINNGRASIATAQHEITHQESLLAKLQQAILQEAIQGKLTADWRVANPKVEPACQLLHRIHAEKARLIAAKKIKPGTKQDSVEDDANSLILPKEWEFPHLDDITMLVTDGTHQTPTYTDSGRIFLSAQNVKPFRFMPEHHKFVSELAYAEYTKNCKAEKGDLLLGRVGAGIGETAVIDRDLDFAFYVSLGMVKTFKKHTVPQYLAIVFNSPYGIRYAKGNTSSLGGSAGNFNLGRIRSFLIPFPSLAEQAEIVTRVEALLTSCRLLAAEIAHTRTHANHLLQAVLKEAFSSSDNRTLNQNRAALCA
ncbi:MAG: restriction endonuclease subunit S [Limisphaerales bacterium]